MPTTNLTPATDQAGIVAETLLAEAQAVQRGQAYVAAAAGVLRRALPAATSILVAARSWSTQTDNGIEVTVIAVHDVDGAALWTHTDPVVPDLPDGDGGWRAVSEVVADSLRRVLEHAAPGPCGWGEIESRHDDPEFDTEHYRITLPRPAPVVPDTSEAERALEKKTPGDDPNRS